MPAVTEGDVVAVWRALTNGADIDERGPLGNTALGLAAARGWDSVVLTLIGGGAALDCVSVTGRTPLLEAVIAGQLAAARMLVAGGSRVGIQLVTSVAAMIAQLEKDARLTSEIEEDWRDFLRCLWERKASGERGW